MTSHLKTAAALIAAGVAFAISGAALAGETIRIEPRPFYGAAVTIEEGVRVFRPLPPTSKVIINPDGETPLSLGFNETTVNQKSYNYHEHQHNGEASGGQYTGSAYYFSGGRIGGFMR